MATRLGIITNERKHARIPVKVICELSNSATLGKLGKGRIINFSFGGLGLITEINLPLYLPVRLAFALNEKKMDVLASITHKKNVLGNLRAYGLRYEAMSPIGKYFTRRRFKHFTGR